MADMNCKACQDLRDEVPQLIINGFDDSMCASLKNDTGLEPSSGHNDCTDLDDMNDCLIGNMETEIESYDVCDWKEFTKMLVNNLWTTLKAMICAICGLWTNVHSLWTTMRSLCIRKSGNDIQLTSNLGVHCTVEDVDTWQPNTSTQNGYVTKGGNDPLKVWSTNSNGVPAWRNSPTLGGHLTLMDHDGHIGETKYWELESTKSISNDSTTGTNAKIKTVTLTKGTWVVAATIGYAPNGTGVRGLGISFGSAGHRKGTLLPACNSAHETILCKTYIHTVSDETEDVYLDTYQDSGSSLNLMVAPETYVNCVRIE